MEHFADVESSQDPDCMSEFSQIKRAVQKLL